MISHIDDSEDTLRRKRLKVASACAECRRRKIKCDGDQPCASCNKAEVECLYAISSNKINRKNDKKQITIAITSTLSNPTPTTTPNTPSFSTIKSKQYKQYPQPIKPSIYHRRFSTSFQPITSNMYSPSSDFSKTPPGASRHSFSHPTRPPSYTISQKRHPPPRRSTTIASIEERLVSIEGLLRVILEKTYSHSDHKATLNNKNVSTTSLPPLYNNNHQSYYYPPPSPPIPSPHHPSSSSAITTMTPIWSLSGSETPNAPPPTTTESSSPPPSPPPPPVMDLLTPSSSSLSSPLPSPSPVITAFHSPNDPKTVIATTSNGQQSLRSNDNISSHTPIQQ